MERIRRPLNKQVIVFYYGNAQKWYTHEYVTTYDIRGECTRDNCPNDDEHLTFDGQIFYKKQLTNNPQ